MLKDKLHIAIDDNECVRTNNIVNGYFYIIYYDAMTEQVQKEGYDRSPVIYCFAPDKNNINCFWAVNFHYFNKRVQEHILQGMIDYYDIADGNDKRVILGTKDLYNLYTNIVQGVRCYNRKGVFDAYRIKNQYIPKYLEVSPEFVITNEDKVNTDFNLAPGNKGF